MKLASLLMTVAVGLAATPSAASDATDATAAIASMLDDWHQAASVADGARYFDHFAPEGIFLGTADGERWDVAAFRAYAEPYFSKGRGWTYVPSARHVVFAPDGATAWFDERLDSPKYGVLRGTGAVRRIDGTWKITQYNMTFLVPNEVSGEVVSVIRAHGATGD